MPRPRRIRARGESGLNLSTSSGPSRRRIWPSRRTAVGGRSQTHPIAKAQLVEQARSSAGRCGRGGGRTCRASSADLEAGGEAARLRLALEHRHAGAAWRQPARPAIPSAPAPITATSAIALRAPPPSMPATHRRAPGRA